MLTQSLTKDLPEHCSTNSNSRRKNKHPTAALGLSIRNPFPQTFFCLRDKNTEQSWWPISIKPLLVHFSPCAKRTAEPLHTSAAVLSIDPTRVLCTTTDPLSAPLLSKSRQCARGPCPPLQRRLPGFEQHIIPRRARFQYARTSPHCCAILQVRRLRLQERACETKSRPANQNATWFSDREPSTQHETEGRKWSGEVRLGQNNYFLRTQRFSREKQYATAKRAIHNWISKNACARASNVWAGTPFYLWLGYMGSLTAYFCCKARTRNVATVWRHFIGESHDQI